LNIIAMNVGKMETQLKKWGAQLDLLVAEADQAGTKVQSDYRERIDDLKSKQRVAQSRLDELRTAGNQKWETLRVGVERAWSDLEGAFENLKKN
jgi:hypothetical protein